MIKKQRSSKSMGLKLDLSSIVRGREYFIQGKPINHSALPYQQKQGVTSFGSRFVLIIYSISILGDQQYRSNS